MGEDTKIAFNNLVERVGNHRLSVVMTRRHGRKAAVMFCQRFETEDDAKKAVKVWEAIVRGIITS